MKIDNFVITVRNWLLYISRAIIQNVQYRLFYIFRNLCLKYLRPHKLKLWKKYIGNIAIKILIWECKYVYTKVWIYCNKSFFFHSFVDEISRFNGMRAYVWTNNSRSEWYKCKLVLVYSLGFANLFIEIFFIHINTFFTSYRGSEKPSLVEICLSLSALGMLYNLLPLLLSIPCTSTNTTTPTLQPFILLFRFSQ